MHSAHLACFAFRTARAGVELIHIARRCAAKNGLPAVFVAVPENQIAALKARYNSQISDEKALDFLLWSAGKKR